MAARDGYPLISPVTQELSASSWKPIGDTLDHAWYRNVLLPSGKPHMAAIAILGRVVYMYRPVVRKIKSEDGLVVGTEVRQKFAADAWQCSREALADMFGFGIREVDAALVLLDKNLGVIKRERRTVVINGVRCSNVLYLCLNISKLKEISTPITFKRNSSTAETEELPRPAEIAPPPKRKTYTKISQQSFLKNNNITELPPVVVSDQSHPTPQNLQAAKDLLEGLPPADRSDTLLTLLAQSLAKGENQDALRDKITKAKGKDLPGAYLFKDLKALLNPQGRIDWNAAKWEEEKQKSDQREAAEAAKRAAAERQEQQAAESKAKDDELYRQYLKWPPEQQQAIKDAALCKMRKLYHFDPSGSGFIDMERGEIINLLLHPQDFATYCNHL